MSSNVAIRALMLTTPIMLWACSSNSGNNNNGTSVGDATAGLTAVTKYSCKDCHGQDMSGSTTPVAHTKATYAANVTPDKDTGIGDWDAATIKMAVLTGVDDEGKQLCGVMPKFGAMSMSDAEANDVVAYLKSLPAVKKEIPESECESDDEGSGASGAAGMGGK